MQAALHPPSIPRKQVMVVETGGSERALIRELFQLRPDIELHLAQDGAEATAIAARLRPALVLLDIQLSDCLGSELLPLLKLRFGWHGVPAVAMVLESEVFAADSTFVEVWRKPLDLSQVLQRLDEWIPFEAPAAPQQPPVRPPGSPLH